MLIEQTSWNCSGGWTTEGCTEMSNAELVLVFAGGCVLTDDAFLSGLKRTYGNAFIFGCSTAGEILSTRVEDDSAAVTAIHFEGTSFRTARIDVKETPYAFDAGKRLAEALPQEGLTHV